MTEFQYEAKNHTGSTVAGIINAADQNAADQKLRSQGLTPLKVKKKSFDFNFNFLNRSVTSKDLKTFTQQFATMIDAGLPLVQCLDILGRQSDNKYFAAKLLEIKGYVESGLTFSDSLAKYPAIFDTLFVNLVAAGELGGILDTIMKRLAEYIEKKEKLQRRIKGAMVYPIAIFSIAIIVIVVLLNWVIPTFETMFADFGAENALPAPTAFVIAISRSFKTNWWIYLVVTIGSAIFISLFKKSTLGRNVLDKTFLYMPIVGPVVRKIAVARFTRTLGTLLSSGVPIIDALNTVAKAAGNVVIERAVVFARDRISEGRNMSEPLASAKVFPGMVIQMIAVGEQTGALDVMCNKIADFYDEEVDVAVASLTSLLEPLMMVFIGGIVGGMVIAMYLPIFELAGTIE